MVLENYSPLTKYLLDEFDKNDRGLLLRYFKQECPDAWHLTIVSLGKTNKNVLKNLSTGHFFLSSDVLRKILLKAKTEKVTLGKVYDLIDNI